MDRIRSGKADREFLERCFHKLLINFAWWVNKVDREGTTSSRAGSSGSTTSPSSIAASALHDGSRLEQSDATGWMGMFCLNLMRIALELARENPVYEALATKFFQHYVLRRRRDEAHGQPRLPALGRAGRVLLRRAAAIPTGVPRSSGCGRWSA